MSFVSSVDKAVSIGTACHCTDITSLRQRFYQLSIAVEQSPVAIAITDVKGRIEYVNQRFLDVTGYAREELLGKTPAVIQSGETAPEVYRDLWQTLNAGKIWRGELLNRRKNGERYWEAEVITPVRDDLGEVVNFVAVKEDITERRRQERELKLLATAFETGQATMITDAEMRIERANQAFTDITGYREEEVLGKTPRIFKSGRHGPEFYQRLWDSLLQSGHWQGEIWNRNKFGEIYPLWQSITAVPDDKGGIRNFVAVFHNIAERKRMEDELERQATRDHLTGAYNRRAFDATLRHAIQQAELDNEPFTLLLFDIDHFKQVNDRHGHDVGDAILKRLAERVADTLRATDILCRWGGEEFTILLPDTRLKGAAVFAERLRHQIEGARLNGLAVTISTGITQYRPGDDTDSLLARADDALYRAKEAGRNRIVVDSEWPASLISTAFHQAGEAMVVADADLKVVAANAAFAELSGVEPYRLQGRCIRELLDKSHLITDPWEMLNARDHVKAEFTYRNRMGRNAPAILSVSRLRDDHGQPSHHLVVLSDLAALAASGRKTGREVYFDALTGLPNRDLLSQLLNESLEHAKRRGARVALCVLDVDHFKAINDRHGQTMGDSLIALLAQRISHLVHGDDILARIAGDEFALILQHGADEAVLSRLLEAVAAPFHLRGEALQVTVSLGVTFYPQDDADGDVLLRHATQAMHRAKQRGRNTFHVFDPRFDRELQAREVQRRRFRQAIENDELCLHYQPQVDMFDGRVIGLEALVRWQHPEQGLLAPGHFLPLVEGASLDALLGEWVLEAALKQLERWQRAGITLPVHVNISPAHLLSGHFVQRLTGLLARYPEVPATRLKLEVLESAAMGDLQAALATMRDCQNLGIDFAIDDFGTGYSSLTHLRQLPVDLIKIDQSFVRDMLIDPDDMAIVESVIFMANRFRRPMLAEGVESLDHARALLALGCAQAQGYGIARPMPAEAIPDWLADWPNRHEWTALAMHTIGNSRRSNVTKA